jgi:hypothetical protein
MVAGNGKRTATWTCWKSINSVCLSRQTKFWSDLILWIGHQGPKPKKQSAITPNLMAGSSPNLFIVMWYLGFWFDLLFKVTEAKLRLSLLSYVKIMAHFWLACTITWHPSSVSRARFVTAGALDPKLCTYVPLGKTRVLTDQISVQSDSWFGH